MKSKAAFLVLEGRDAGRVISIGKFPFRIGRNPDNDLVIADEQTSRYHAQVEKTADGPKISDLRSRNGLFVDGEKVDQQLLRPGDRVRIGSTVLVFHRDVETAHSVTVDTIPDSPAFAMGLPDQAADLLGTEPDYDEPTSPEAKVETSPRKPRKPKSVPKGRRPKPR